MIDQFIAEGMEHGRAELAGDRLLLRAGPCTDWFHKPDGSGRASNVIRLTRQIQEPVFVLAARVEVGFAATYDAGALFVACGPDHWAKLAFERSAGGQPTIVSVVTRVTSDDADGPVHDAGPVWLRLYCDGRVVAFHHSADGRLWRFSRLFTLPELARRPIVIGLAAQSPTGSGCAATFSEVTLTFDTIADLRDGS